MSFFKDNYAMLIPVNFRDVQLNYQLITVLVIMARVVGCFFGVLVCLSVGLFCFIGISVSLLFVCNILGTVLL